MGAVLIFLKDKGKESALDSYMTVFSLFGGLYQISKLSEKDMVTWNDIVNMLFRM